MHSHRARQWLTPALPLFAILASFLTGSVYHHQVLALAAVYALAAAGLSLLQGYLGELSLATPAFFGIGAYAVAILVTRYEAGPLVVFVAAVGLSTVLAGVVGVLTIRIGGLPFAIMTFALSGIVAVVAESAVSLTGGPFGISGIDPLRIGTETFISNREILVVTCLLSSAILLLCTNLLESPWGAAANALKSNPVRAQASGIYPLRVRIVFILLSSAVIAVGGVMYGYTIRLVSPQLFGFHMVVLTLVMVILGGRGLAGTYIAAYALIVIPEMLRAVGDYRQLAYAGLLVAYALLAGTGVLTSLRNRAERAFSAQHASPWRDFRGLIRSLGRRMP